MGRLTDGVLSQQSEASHVSVDIGIVQRMQIILFHPRYLVDEAVGFVHVDDQPIVAAVKD